MDVHRCRFVPYQPSAINALAFSHPSNLNYPGKGPPDLRLAIGRANGDIEIWNPLKGVWYQETVFRGGKDRSIEGLLWIQDQNTVHSNGYKSGGKLRIFSIGYSTVVTEWNLGTGRPVRHSSGNHGEIWCMAAQPKATTTGKEVEDAESQDQSIAVGCADGAIVLLNTADDDLRFSRVLARPSKKKSRVLSLTFQNRHTIIAGHADSTIRIYDTRNKQQVRNMTLGAGPKGGPRETLIWAVKCLADGTIISGDSNGTMSFWNGNNYTLTQQIKSHEADILDLAVSADGQSVFSGSMDRRTTLHRCIGSGKPENRLRWAKITHQRFHRHDVKAMATYESKSMSILASGGLDTAPLIVPIQEFGREYHRTLSNLPQEPMLRSAPTRRLVMSWSDRELSIWKMSRSRSRARGSSSEVGHPEGRKLVARIALQGEESITSADLSSDGSFLAVSTMTEQRLFHLEAKSSHLKVHRLETQSAISRVGAKSSHISPDMKWLAVTRVDNSMQIYRIVECEESKISHKILTSTVILKRLHRDYSAAKHKHGSLGNYDRSITRLAFSADSRILAVADLSGFIDTWVLEGQEDLLQDNEEHAEPRSSIKANDVDSDDASDEDSDEEQHSTIILGQRWIRNPSASLIIKLPSAPLVLSFRPSSRQSPPRLTNGIGIHPTRHTPHPHTHDLPNDEDRLFILTAENQMYEINVLSGRISDWSRRNPTSSLPRAFRDLKDRAMGAVWDICEERERIWVHGISWLWMFDLSQDLVTAIKALGNALVATNGEEAKQLKRKREHLDEYDSSDDGPQNDTGAGSRVRRSELHSGIGRKMRRIKGDEADKGQDVSMVRDESPASDDEGYDAVLANEDSQTLVSLRRDATEDGHLGSGDSGDGDGDTSDHEKRHERLSHWHTFKYRPILGIVPLGNGSDDEGEEDGRGESDEEPPSSLEVALVERPIWDVDLPPKYYGNQEWDP